MKRTFLFLFNLFLLYGCISIKSDYPEINLYRLTQETKTNNSPGSVKGTLQVRSFSSSEQLYTDNIIAIWDGERIQHYFYHRWVSAPADLVTDFLIGRMSDANIFGGGVVKPSSLIIPDYILEGNLLDMIAYNTKDKEPDSNYVSVSLEINLIKREPLTTTKNILLNKVYNRTIPRQNNEVKSIPPAFSNAMSQIADRIITDIYDAVNKQQSQK
jgi:ABC-type uncharacterized transport system auxiliary subunit